MVKLHSILEKADRSAGWRYSPWAFLALVLGVAAAQAGAPSTEPPTKTREIYVPMADLKVLLEGEPHRVLLARQEYDELVKKAKKTPETHVPHSTVIVSSDYDITVEDGRARFQGTLAIDVLDDGLHAVPLDFGGVGLLAAKLDGQPAPIGYAERGRLSLLVSGPGRHALTLDLVAPLEMNSAQQSLSFRLTNAPVGRWRLTVPGDVEIKGGADMLSRAVDTAAKVTRFELLPRCGDSTILMSLNSHFQRREQAVASRCVLFDEVTEAYEKLHATVTFWILHRAVDRFRFAVPEGFEITEINSPLLAHWDIETEAGRKIVNVRLREQTTDTVVLSIAAIKTPSQLKQWRLPRLELLDVVGQVTVLGLVVQDELKTESLAARDLIPVDTGVLAAALPVTLLRPEAGAVPLRYIAAYYAPQGGYELKADFSRAPATLSVTTNLLLKIQDKGCEVQGGFALLPTAEKRFGFDFSVPPGWSVSEVTGPDKAPLAIERFTGEKLPSPPGKEAGVAAIAPRAGPLPKGEGDQPGRVHVKLPQGIAPGQLYVASFRGQFTPPGWLSSWKSQSLEFPMFRVADAERDEGAVAVVAEEDMEVRPDKLAGLVPITQAEMSRFGMASGAMNLAYRYERVGGKATIVVDRIAARATARTFSFFQIVPGLLKAHDVVIYTIEDAKTRRLALLLPASTPEALTIRGLEGVSVKEFTSEASGTMRRWNVLLDEARRGEVRLAVDFEMRPQSAEELDRALAAVFEGEKPAAAEPDASGKVTELNDFELPLVKADAVVYQSGLLAIEGDLELAVDVKTAARRADVGQFAIAKYTPASLEPVQQRPGECGGQRTPMRLLGTYEFVGETPKVAVDVVRNPSYALTPAIVERARLATLLSADGTSQTQAAFQLRTKASYLEVELPPKASLWSVVLDGAPLKPQKQGGVRLIGLPPGTTGLPRNLQIVYEAPVQSLASGNRLNLTAPRLLYRASRDLKQPTEIPLVNIEWNVTVPDGYEVVATDGTLESKSIARPTPAPLVVAGALYEMCGGVNGPGFMMMAGDSKSVSGAKSMVPKPAASSTTTSTTTSEHGLSTGRNDEDNYGIGASHAEGLAINKLPGKDAEKASKSEAAATMQWRSKAAAETPTTPPTPAKTESVTVVAPSINGAVLANASPAAVPATPPPPPAVSAPVFAGPAANPPSPAESPTGGSRGNNAIPKPDVTQNSVLSTQNSTNSDYAASDYSVTKPTYQRGDLLGFRSLKIDVQQSGSNETQLVTFNSLGADPQIGITLVCRNRNTFLVWGIALAVFALGVALTKRPVRQKAALVLGLALVSALLPLAWDTVSVARICNGVFYAAALLVPYYLAAGVVCWLFQRLRSIVGRFAGPTATAAALVLAMVTMLSAPVQAQPQAAEGKSLAAEREEYLAPVAVPADAIIVPYDVKSKTGVRDADHLLVSYERYVELWNRAYPDKKIEAHPAPLPFAMSGAAYRATLEGEETLNITGQIEIDVLAEGYVSVPLGLRGGVLARADLDGKPAQLKVVSAAEPAMMIKGGKRATAMDATLLLLQVSGKGSHKLELEVRLKLGHVGGWRGTNGSLPTAPAATVSLRVPQPQTEVRLGQAVDRRVHETGRPDETLETALGPGGALQLQWRPKVAEAQVDRGLTVESAALLDVQEDGLRMQSHIKLEFRRGQREAFTLLLPGDYLVEKVAGNNVRGWEVRRAAADPQAEQSVEVSLLKMAKDSEQINLFLSRSGRVGQAGFETFSVPLVTVRDAALSSGQLTIRRSPLLDLRTMERSGVTRIDLGPLPDLSGGPATDESVLAIRPYEAYRFPTMPFVLRLSAAPTVADVTANVQTSVNLDAAEPGLDSKITFHVGQRRVYRLEVAVPDDLRLPEVTLPAGGVWSIEKHGPRSVLEVYLQQGALGEVPLILRGKLAAVDGRGPVTDIVPPGLKAAKESGPKGNVLWDVTKFALPRLEVLEVKRQEGDIAVQADPAFTVQARDLRDCQETELDRVAAWLDPQFRAATRLALHYSSGAYGGTLRLAPRTPEVVCDTVTNVRITDRAIEETIFLNYTIRNAGIHELTFLLPASMRDARITTPLLRRKTIDAVDPKAADGLLRVRLELQGDVMNDLQVLVMNDRLLTPGSHAAPLPGFEAAVGGATGFVRHQYVVLQMANRDELIVEPLVGLELISRQQQQWQALSDLLGKKRLYQAYLIQPGAVQPRLSFHLDRHEDLETAGARIDLAQTTLAVDANGAYRAKLELSLDNTSEQFLDVELPVGAKLWTVHVAGEPVKPAQVPGAVDARHVLLPVRKTAKGDLNYLVVLKYGGQVRPLSLLSSVEFPLIHAVKSYPKQTSIGIEQSLVEIYVPKSHQWFGFGGTVHSTEDEADLKAGRIAAFNKQGQRLIEATHDKDPFARVRATENLRNWVSEAEKNQAESGRGVNKALQSQISESTNTAQQAKELLKSSSGDQQQEDESTVDNRDRLTDVYTKQGNVIAGQQVLSGNNSYTGGTTLSAGTLIVQNGTDFNNNWIVANSLGTSSVVAQQAAPANRPAGGGAQSSPFYLQDDARYFPPGAQFPLTKTGSGALALSGANTYSGVTTFNAGGTLALGNAANTYNGTAILNNGTLQNANPNLANGRIILNNDQQFGGLGNGPTTTLPGNSLMNNGDILNAKAGDQGGQGNTGNPSQYFGYRGAVGNAPVSQGSAMAQPNAPAQQQFNARRSAVRVDQQRELAVYQQKLSIANNASLADAQRGEQADQSKPSQDGLDARPSSPAEVAQLPAPASPQPPLATPAPQNYSDMVYDPGSSGAVAAATAPTGLASLDFTMPTDKNLYELYRFTTPRGEAELTARTISNSTLARLELLLGFTVAGLLIWGVYWLIRCGALAWLRRPAGATLLTVVGLASFCGGVLPIAGLVAMLTGICLLVAYFWRRSDQGAAAA